jgi:hypothetical protein
METGREDSITPQGGTGPDDKILREARRRLESAWQHDRHNREQASIDLRFLGLDQWPESIRTQREQSNRPCLTLDHLNQYKNQVVNEIRQSKVELRAVAADEGENTELADLMTELMRDIQYNSDASHVYATAADGAVSCGIGHFRLETNYVDGEVFNQDIKIKSIPYPLAVYWDPAAVLPDRSDAQFCFVVEFIPEGTFKELYPGVRLEDVQIPKDWDGGFHWASQDGVLVAEYWCKKTTKQRLVAFESGITLEVGDDEDILALEAIHGPVKGEREAEGHKVVQYLLTGSEVLEGPNDWAGKHIPVIPVIGEEINLETKTVRKSLIRAARDGQQLYNYWRSAAAELIALAPKSKWLATAHQIGARKAEWDTAHVDPKPYLVYTPDPKAPGVAPQQVSPPAPPAAIWQEAALVVDDMKAATGIYEASLGAKGNETSGTAILRRQAEGDTANYHFTANFHRSLMHAGRVLLDIIPRIYDSERTVRLMAADDSYRHEKINELIPAGMDGRPMVLNDLSAAKMDIRVSIGPSFASQRIEAASRMLEYIQVDQQALPAMRDLLVKSMDWPDAQLIADRLKKTVPAEYLSENEQAIAANDPAMQQQQAATAAANQLALQKAEAEVMKTQAEVEQTKVETQLKVMQANGKAPAQSNGASSQQPVIVASTPGSVQMGLGAEEIYLLVESLGHQGQGQTQALAQGLAQLAQAISQGNAQTAQTIAQTLSEALAQQGGLMGQAVAQLSEGSNAVVEAVEKLKKPRIVTVTRDGRGNLTGGVSRFDEDDEEVA